MENIIPENWDSLTQEANDFLNSLAEKYIENKDNLTDKKIVTNFSKEVSKFMKTPMGVESDIHSKETSNQIIDFLNALTKDTFTEESIISIWQNAIY